MRSVKVNAAQVERMLDSFIDPLFRLLKELIIQEGVSYVDDKHIDHEI